MEHMNFFLALVVASLSFVGGSLLWARLTKQPPPAAVEQVRNVVVQTQVGKQAASVLGVSDEAHVQPINISKTASDVISAGEQAVEQRIQYIIVQNAINQLMPQIDKLPKDQQTEIRQQLCVPPVKH